MDDFTSALKEALDGGKSLDEAAKEILRKQTEKAVNTIIRERGVKRCDVVVSDGFVGMKEIVRGRFPDCRYQRCFVHLARNAGDMVRPSGMQSIVADFMSLAKLGGKDEAVAGLARFREDWAGKYPSVGRWVDRPPKDDAFAFYAFREEVRYIAYTNNRIEAFNSEIERAAKKHIKWSRRRPRKGSSPTSPTTATSGNGGGG